METHPRRATRAMRRPGDVPSPPVRGAPPSTVHRIEVDRIWRWLFHGLGAAMAALLVLDHVFEVRRVVDSLDVRQIFNMAREDSLSNWLSSTVLLLTGLSLGANWFWARARCASRGTQRGFLLLAGFFTYMAIDDAVEIHERVGRFLGMTFRRGADDHPAVLQWYLDLPAYSWQLFLGPVFVGVGVYACVFLTRRFRRHGLAGWVWAGLACYACAIGLDALEKIDGWTGSAKGFDKYLLEHNARVLEELLEIFGTTCLWIASLRYLAAEMAGTSFEVSPDRLSGSPAATRRQVG